MKNLYLLTRRDSNITYDAADGFVVRARSLQVARRLASKQAGDEGASYWLSPLVEWALIGSSQSDREEVILRDFHAG